MNDPRIGGGLRNRRTDQRSRRPPVPPLYHNVFGDQELHHGAGLKVVDGILVAARGQAFVIEYRGDLVQIGNATSGDPDWYKTKAACVLPPSDVFKSGDAQAKLVNDWVTATPGQYLILASFEFENTSATLRTIRVAVTARDHLDFSMDHDLKSAYPESRTPFTMMRVVTFDSSVDLFARAGSNVADEIEMDRGYVALLRLGDV